MNKIHITGNSAAASLTGFASNVTGATFTLTATNSGDGLAHQVTVRNDSITNHSAKTLTLTGTDADGRPQTETMAAPGSSATVTSTKFFLSLPDVAVSASIGADTFDIGWAAASVSPTAQVQRGRLASFNIGFGVTVNSGSPNYTVQHTYDGVTWFSHATVSGETTSQEGAYTSPVAGIRMSWAASGEATLTGYQVGD